MLKIKVLPANCGDCFIISFDDGGIIKNILIDGGVGITYKKYLKHEIENIKKENQNIDLLIITHSHEDHINGIIKFIEDNENNDCIKKIWFNSGIHFKREKIMMLTQNSDLDISIKQIKYLEDKLVNMKFMGENVWNKEVIQQGFIENFNNGKITVLSPNKYGLKKLEDFTQETDDLMITGKNYDYSTKLVDFDLNNFEEDCSIENSTSISILFEYSDKKLLFLADSTPSIIIEGLVKTNALASNKKIDFVKLSHHASKNNLNDQLLQSIECENYIISTHGKCANKLPNKETFARIIKHFKSINLYFNYKNDIIEKIFSNDELSGDKHNVNITYLSENNYEIEVVDDNKK